MFEINVEQKGTSSSSHSESHHGSSSSGSSSGSYNNQGNNNEQQGSYEQPGNANNQGNCNLIEYTKIYCMRQFASISNFDDLSHWIPLSQLQVIPLMDHTAKDMIQVGWKISKHPSRAHLHLHFHYMFHA